jgi:2-dehydropantoate 2-reductase
MYTFKSEIPMKKVVIVGPGGIGGTIAAILAHKGACEVTIVGRSGAHMEAIRRDGLRIIGLQEFTVPIEAIDDPKQIQACDVLIFSMKAQDMQTALERTAHIQVHDAVFSLQNGVIKDDLLVEVFGKEKVIGALSVIASGRPESGVINWTFDGGTQFGELDGHPSKRVDYLTKLFQQAGFDAIATDGILSATWTKVVGWIPIGLLGTLSRQKNAGILSNKLLAIELVEMVRELNALAATRGISLINFGPYQVKTWCEGTLDEAVADVMINPLTKSPSTHSALQDILKGQPTEFKACVGPMIEEAHHKGVAMPRTQAMYAALMGLEATL